MNIYILAIESSCDDTSASVIHNGKIINNVVASQEVHEKYGGVVPELASRAHQSNIVPVVNAAINDANISKSQLTAIAFTKGPGLLGSLLVGVSFAKGMALSLGIPLISVNHMQAHIMAHFIDDPKPKFPFLCLTVSGGHTQIVRVDEYSKMEILGSTLDDAVGEAFDKTAKLLGLPYPGGPLIDKYSQDGNPDRFTFPDTSVPGLNYSFSGIKTAILYFLRDEKLKNPGFIEENLNDICASIQQKLIDMLVQKLKKAAKQNGIREIAIAGGVSANSGLRKRMQEEAVLSNWKVYIPDFQYCTDNAAMIAMTGYFQFLNNDFSNQSVSPTARMKI